MSSSSVVVLSEEDAEDAADAAAAAGGWWWRCLLVRCLRLTTARGGWWWCRLSMSSSPAESSVEDVVGMTIDRIVAGWLRLNCGEEEELVLGWLGCVASWACLFIGGDCLLAMCFCMRRRRRKLLRCSSVLDGDGSDPLNKQAS
jgi:hypothetical protein